MVICQTRSFVLNSVGIRELSRVLRDDQIIFFEEDDGGGGQGSVQNGLDGKADRELTLY